MGNEMTALSNREWIERTARIMGTPSPAAAPFIGQKIGNSNRRVDQFANNICSAIMPGGGHARLHDHMLYTIQDEAHRAGFHIEVEPDSLFRHCVPINQQPALHSAMKSKQGIRPDFVIRGTD